MIKFNTEISYDLYNKLPDSFKSYISYTGDLSKLYRGEELTRYEPEHKFIIKYPFISFTKSIHTAKLFSNSSNTSIINGDNIIKFDGTCDTKKVRELVDQYGLDFDIADDEDEVIFFNAVIQLSNSEIVKLNNLKVSQLLQRKHKAVNALNRKRDINGIGYIKNYLRSDDGIKYLNHIKFIDSEIDKYTITESHDEYNIGPLYRGISKYSDAKFGSYTFKNVGDAVFYTRSKEYASKYNAGGGVVVAMLKAVTPLLLDSGDTILERIPTNFWKKLTNEERDNIRSFDYAYTATWTAIKPLILYAKKYNYDCIRTEEAGETWVIFNPNNIKIIELLT